MATIKPKGGARKGAGGTLRPLGISLEDGRRLRQIVKAQGEEYGEEAVKAWLERHIAADHEALTAREWAGEVL